MTAHVLVVEDETVLAASLRRGLILEGYSVSIVHDGRAALTLLRTQTPDIIILDWMLPGVDGLEIARRVRALGSTPLIMLTAREAVTDRVMGLQNGADDYLCKPFAFEELLARIQVQLRRAQAQAAGEVLCFGPIVLDVAAHTVHVGTRPVRLTVKEFEVLELLLRHQRQVLTRAVFYERIWGYDFDGEGNAVEVYIGALRQKLEAQGAPRLIHTVRSIGYVLREAP
jgi:DNA-binding response OmpR family regulator